MTETLQRPARTVPRREADPVRSAAAQGASAGLWAALAGLLAVALPVLLVWAVDSRSGTGWVEVLRTSGRLWLVAHGASLQVPGGDVSLTPLGLLLLPLAVLVRFTTVAARESGATGASGARQLALWTALPYGGLALLVALLCSGPEVHVSPVASLTGGLLLGALGGALGVLRGGVTVPARSRPLLAGTAAATALLLGAGAALVGGSLLRHLDRAVELAGSGDPGPVGGIALLAAGLALLPNAAVWGAAWLTGPGFAVGVGTAVGPFGHELGPVPSLPLLAALPGGGVPEWVAVLVLAVPVLAGGVAGVLVERGRRQVAAAGRTALEAAATGPLVGVVLGVLAWLSGGAAGGERLATTGPAALPVALATAGLVAAGAAAGALVVRARRVEAAA